MIRVCRKSALILCFCIGIQEIVALSLREKKSTHVLKTLNKKSTELVVRLGEDNLNYFRNEILRPFLRTRVSGSAGNLEVQQHIKRMMSQLGWTIEEDKFQDMTPFGKVNFTNIIATQNPQAARKLVLACHFDSKFFEKFVFIGAIDSAVPCALMIDLAHLLQPYLNYPQTDASDISLEFIFFDGEEAFDRWTSTDSLYGARHLARKMSNELIQVDREIIMSRIDSIDALVLLDLIGSSDTVFSKIFSDTGRLYDRLQSIESRLIDSGFLSSRSSPLFRGSSLTGMEIVGGIQDDHIPFLQKGVPVLHLISHPFPSVWHKEADNESALDYDVITRLSAILRVFIVEYLHLYLDV